MDITLTIDLPAGDEASIVVGWRRHIGRTPTSEVTVAKSLKAQIESAKKVLAGQTSRVFLEAAMGRDTPFRECLTRVGVSTAEGYEYAKKRLEDLELEAVTMGKAYRGSFGQLIWR